MNKHQHPPKLGLLLLEYCLPHSIKDDIIGDLHEQYFESKAQKFKKQSIFWWQVVSTITRYFMVNNKTIAFFLSAVSCSIFFIFMSAVLFLSNNNDANAFSQAYWTDGNFYQFFLDSALYQHMSISMFENISPQLFINIPSILWASVGFALLYFIQRVGAMNLRNLAFASMLLLFLPYLWAMSNFKMYDIPLRESGPILAFTLISVLYLIIPLTVLFIKELNKQNKLV